MSKRSTTHLPSALRHGVYSGLTLLPGEDADAFEKLHADLIDEYAPSGRHEEDIVESLSRLIWRKQNLSTYRLAKQAELAHSSIYYKANTAAYPTPIMPLLGGEATKTHSPEQIRALYKDADERARTEPGPALELAKLGEIGTIDYLLQELDLRDRLDGMTDRALKRLLFVRGLKSLSPSQSPPSQPRGRKVT